MHSARDNQPPPNLVTDIVALEPQRPQTRTPPHNVNNAPPPVRTDPVVRQIQNLEPHTAFNQKPLQNSNPFIPDRVPPQTQQNKTPHAPPDTKTVNQRPHPARPKFTRKQVKLLQTLKRS
eukprot:3175065-Rhodomonas_salina.1